MILKELKKKTFKVYSDKPQEYLTLQLQDKKEYYHLFKEKVQNLDFHIKEQNQEW